MLSGTCCPLAEQKPSPWAHQPRRVTLLKSYHTVGHMHFLIMILSCLSMASLYVFPLYTLGFLLHVLIVSCPLPEWALSPDGLSHHPSAGERSEQRGHEAGEQGL